MRLSICVQAIWEYVMCEYLQVQMYFADSKYDQGFMNIEMSSHNNSGAPNLLHLQPFYKSGYTAIIYVLFSVRYYELDMF